jgi:hypothetical protein
MAVHRDDAAAAAAAAESSQRSSQAQSPQQKRGTPFFEPLPWTAWSPTAATNALGRDIASMNSTILADLQGLSSIPRVYAALFHRTRNFAATVRQLVSVLPGVWAQAACLLIDWGVRVLRHPEIRLERFLNSQRESLYWILDDALLRICLDQWDPPAPVSLSQPQPQPPHTTPSEHTSCTWSSLSGTILAVPWDVATRPITQSLSYAQTLVPLWGQQDVEETKKWRVPVCEGAVAEWFETGWFRRSRQFLKESNRIYEIWRTMRRAGKGQLPAELANVIVQDVAASENLPMEDLRQFYFPTEKRAHG